MQKQSPAAELLLHRMGALPLQVGFYDKAADFPVYTLSDVEENVEKYGPVLYRTAEEHQYHKA